jgi:putative membrane protein
MNPHRYDHFEEEELILRDQLAIDRTMLSNDRTMLSFVRTALTLIIAGGTILHFLEGRKWDTLGWFVLFLGFTVLIVGIIRYRRIYQALTNAIKTMKYINRAKEDQS